MWIIKKKRTYQRRIKNGFKIKLTLFWTWYKLMNNTYNIYGFKTFNLFIKKDRKKFSEWGSLIQNLTLSSSLSLPVFSVFFKFIRVNSIWDRRLFDLSTETSQCVQIRNQLNRKHESHNDQETAVYISQLG